MSARAPLQQACLPVQAAFTGLTLLVLLKPACCDVIDHMGMRSPLCVWPLGLSIKKKSVY